MNTAEDIIKDIINCQYVDGSDSVLLMKVLLGEYKKDKREEIEEIIASLIDDGNLDGEDAITLMKFIIASENKSESVPKISVPKIDSKIKEGSFFVS